MRNKLLALGLILGSSGCLALCGDYGEPKEQPDFHPTEVFDKRVSSPENLDFDRNFAVGDDVSVIHSDATYSVDGVVVSVDAKLADLAARIADAGPDPDAARVERSAQWIARRGAGYQVRVGVGAAAKTTWYASTNVFPAPWAGVANIKVGESFARHGTAAGTGQRKKRPPIFRCTVTKLGDTRRDDVMATCEGDTAPASVKRREMAVSFIQATKGDALHHDGGEIVWVEDTWALVTDRSTGTTDYIVREADGANDKLVDYSLVEVIPAR